MTALSLADAKAALRYPNPTQPHKDDPLIEMFTDAIVDVAEYHCGALSGAQFTENHDGGEPFIDTFQRPILSVSSVRESWGAYAWSLDFLASGQGPTLTSSGGNDGAPVASSPFAYSIDSYELGCISRRGVGNALQRFKAGVANVEIIYAAGVAVIPSAVKLGIVEGLQHMWQNSMLRAAGESAGYLAFDATSGEHPSIDYALPYRCIQMFRSHSRMPIIG